MNAVIEEESSDGNSPSPKKPAPSYNTSDPFAEFLAGDPEHEVRARQSACPKKTIARRLHRRIKLKAPSTRAHPLRGEYDEDPQSHDEHPLIINASTRCSRLIHDLIPAIRMYTLRHIRDREWEVNIAELRDAAANWNFIIDAAMAVALCENVGDAMVEAGRTELAEQVEEALSKKKFSRHKKLNPDRLLGTRYCSQYSAPQRLQLFQKLATMAGETSAKLAHACQIILKRSEPERRRMRMWPEWMRLLVTGANLAEETPRNLVRLREKILT